MRDVPCLNYTNMSCHVKLFRRAPLCKIRGVTERLSPPRVGIPMKPKFPGQYLRHQMRVSTGLTNTFKVLVVSYVARYARLRLIIIAT